MACAVAMKTDTGVAKSLRFGPPDPDEWVTHAKTREVSDRCADIEAAQVALWTKVQKVWLDASTGVVSQERVVSDAYLFAQEIGRLAPDCADKSAAMRSLRLGWRMVWLVTVRLMRGDDPATIQHMAEVAKLRIEEAKVQAQDAVVIQFAKQARAEAEVRAYNDALAEKGGTGS